MRALLLASVALWPAAALAQSGTPYFKSVRGDVTAATVNGMALSTIAGQAAGAIQAAGGNASAALVTATGASSPRTMAAISADELAAATNAAGAVQAIGGNVGATVANPAFTNAYGQIGIAATPRSMASRASDAVNVADFGAKPDFQYLVQQFYMPSGSAVLTAGSGRFTSADVGKTVVVPGAGASGAALVASIASVTSASTVTLSKTASTTIGSSPASGSPVISVEIGTDNTTAINTAMGAAVSLVRNPGSQDFFGSNVVVPSGEYLTLGSLDFTGYNTVAGRSSPIDGDGVTILAHGARIHSLATGYPAVDMVTSRYMQITGLAIYGDQYQPPRVGLQLGRNGTTSQNSGDNQIFQSLGIGGAFTLAGLLNEQSETTQFTHALVSNSYPGGYGAIFDGVNHFAMTSQFVTINKPAESGQSFDEQTLLNSIISSSGVGGAPMWLSDPHRMRILGSYMVQNAPAGASPVQPAAVLYLANGTALYDLEWDVHAEGNLTDVFEVTAPAGVTYGAIGPLKLYENAPFATNSVFKIDPASSLSTLYLNDADIKIEELPVATKLFDAPSAWTVSGKYSLPLTMTGLPTNFSGVACSLNGPCDASSLAVTPAGGVQSTIGALAGSAQNAVQKVSTGSVQSVAITPGNGWYYAQSTAYTPTLTFGAPPTGGTQAAGHISTFTTNGGTLGGGGAASDGYTSGTTYPTYDAAGNLLPFTTTVNASGGVVTGIVSYNPVAGLFLANGTIPALPYKIGSGGATLTAFNWLPQVVAIDNPGSGYVSPPSIVASTANQAGTAWGYQASLGYGISAGSITTPQIKTGQGVTSLALTSPPSGNFYDAPGVTVALTCTIAAPASGTAATCHPTTLSVYGGSFNGLAAGGQGYVVGNTYPIVDSYGDTLGSITVGTIGTGGSITSARAYASSATAVPARGSTIPTGPYTITGGTAGSLATINAANFAISGIALDSPGMGYASGSAPAVSITASANQISAGAGTATLGPVGSLAGALAVAGPAFMNSGASIKGGVTLPDGGRVSLDATGAFWVQEVAGKVEIGSGATNLFSIDSSGNVIAAGTVTQGGSP